MEEGDAVRWDRGRLHPRTRPARRRARPPRAPRAAARGRARPRRRGRRGWRKWTTSIPSPDEIPADIERRLAAHAAGRILPWATCLPDGTPVGETTYWDIDEDSRRVEIGATWLGASAQGTRINPEAKLLQLAHAFDDLDCIAVEFRTHWHNRQSRRAIAALGAKQDGVLRNHKVMRDGSLRDTVVFSIIRDEWPAVRAGLRARLAVA